MAFLEERRRPSGVLGPVLRAALARFARRCRSVAIGREDFSFGDRCPQSKRLHAVEVLALPAPARLNLDNMPLDGLEGPLLGHIGLRENSPLLETAIGELRKSSPSRIQVTAEEGVGIFLVLLIRCSGRPDLPIAEGTEGKLPKPRPQEVVAHAAITMNLPLELNERLGERRLVGRSRGEFEEECPPQTLVACGVLSGKKPRPREEIKERLKNLAL